MLGRSIVGERIVDVLTALKFLSTHGGHTQVHVVAHGYGAIPAAFASLLHPSVAEVTLKKVPTSFNDIATAEVYEWPLSSFVPNILKYVDLPDVYRELQATKRLRLIDPVGAEGPS
jgi:hypothetical protein